MPGRKTVSTFAYRVELPAKMSNPVLVMPANIGPGTLRHVQIADDTTGFTVYQLADLSFLPQNLWPPSFPITVGPQTFFCPLIEVQLYAAFGFLGSTSGMTASTTFAFNTTNWSGSFGTDASGVPIGQNMAISADLYLGGYLQVSAQNLSSAAVATEVRVIMEQEVA